MKYTRKFEKRNPTGRAAGTGRTGSRTLARKILSAVTALSVIGNPFATLAASVVTRYDKPNDNIMTGNVGNIYAETVKNDVAVNRFDKFQIGAGDIANMYFQTQGSSQWAGSLVNFVNNRIDVAGTVNAIKDNQIGGNLYFLSASGMAVTGSGVINAGSLFVMTPTQDFMDGILGNQFSIDDFVNNEWNQISTMQVPLNASGTITVEGQIHTTDGINLRAAHIQAGGENASSDAGALLETGVLDFKDFVKLDASQQEAAGLRSLTATQTGSGDIVLSAVATERNEYDDTFDTSTTDSNLIHASVSVAGGSEVKAVGDVNITAAASSGEAYDKYFTDESGETADELDVWGQIVKTKADITIDGTVTGQHVNAAAESHNSFITAGITDPDLGDINAFIGAAAINLDGGYAVLGGEASVNVGESASITATGQDTDTKKALSLTADSVVRAAAGASTTAIKLANFKHTGNVPSAGAAYAKAENDASVTVAGSVTAEKGSMDIAANAETHLEAAASNNTTYVGGNINDQTRINAAVTIADGSNTSRVDIQDTANVSAAARLDIAATGTNSVNTQALVKGKESAMAATAVNYTNYDSSADVNVDANLTGSSVSVTAGNIVLENTVIANSDIGSGMLMTSAVNEAVNSQTVGTIKGAVLNIKNRIYQSEDTVGTLFDGAADLFSLGASIGVVEESFTSGVRIGKDINISAADADGKKGDINVAANTVIQDTHMQAAGVSNNYTEENDQEEVLINAAVLYADMDSEANVIVEGGSGDAYTGLDGANVTVAAHSEFQYNRINKMIGELLLLCDELKGAYASNETYKANVEKLANLAKAYEDNIAKDPNYADSTEGNEAAMALAAAAQQVSVDAQNASVTSQIKDIFIGPFSVAGAAAQFANPANYANFQASGGTSGNKDASAGVAGSVNINKLSNTAFVLVGKGAQIAAEGKADLDAHVEQNDVSITGRIGLNSGAETVAGGSVGVHFGETHSLVAVAEGASISGSSVALGADNDVTHTGIVINAGKGGTNGLSGMAGYMEGDSSAVISVDDEASLAASSGSASDTEENKDQSGLVSINAENTTVITNIAGGGAIGQAAAIGASVGITNYTVDTVAAVTDNDADASRGEEEPVSGLAGMVYRGLTDEEKGALFGTAANKMTDTGITAEDFAIHALNDSVINTITIAGSATTGDDSDEPGIFDKIGNFVSNTGNRIHNGFNTIDSKLSGAFPDKMKELAGTVNDPGKRPTNMQATNANMGANLPSLSIAGAGSASVNLVSGSTAALVENANIHLTKKDAKVQAGAEDSGFIGAWSGAGAISWKQAITEQNWNNTNVGLAGAVGVNVTATDVVSLIRGSSIDGASSISNTAKKDGALVAAGLGLAAAKAGQGGNGSYNGAASVSVNLSDNDISALMEDNTVNENADDGAATALTNGAYDSDTQVTGGINMSVILGGEKGVAIGGTVGYSELTNEVTSRVSGGTYKDMGAVDVHALSDITQVGAAVGVSASAAQKKNIGFNGVAAYNQLNNTVTAGIENADIAAAAVGVRAQDTDLGTKKYDTYLEDRGIDADGSSYIENVKDTTTDLANPGTSGNTIVTGALGVTVAAGENSGAGAAAISISDINNDFDAHITGGTISASGSGDESVPDVNVYAKSDTLLVGVAAGGAGSGNISGAGSVTWQTIDNDTTASIDSAAIHADSTAVRALNGTLGVNVAGQISVGKTAVGLAIAYNNMENTTGAYVKGGTVESYTEDGSASVNVNAENAGKLYAIGAGVGVSTETAAANGTIAINIGRNNTEALIDADEEGNRAKLSRISSLNVTTEDKSGEFALAGGVGAGKGAAVGGAVAYNEIGSLSGSDEEKKQQNTAQVNRADITTADGAKVNVNAGDTSSLDTIAVGVGVSAGGSGASVAVQGAAATALIDKNTEASMTDTVIKAADNVSGADVDIRASSVNELTTSADVASVAVGGASVSVGAGVAVNRSEADVAAYVDDGEMNVNDLRIDAANRANIETIGVGGSVAGGTGAGVTGSVAVNQINNGTLAGIRNGAQITAGNNVVVGAAGDEQIANYAGSASVTATGAAIGVSVSVNQIDSMTDAAIEGDETKVTALGRGDETAVKDTVADGSILDDFVDENAFESGTSLADSRTDSTYKGVAVSASSTHNIKSFLINAGGTGTGAAVNGTVNVNQIDGATTAAIRGADINSASGASDVSVVAHDYTNSAGIVGTANVTGTGASVGLGSDTNTVSRDVTAEVTGGASAKNTVHAADLVVDADAKQGISSLTTGVSIAGIGAAVSNATSVALLDGKTTARLHTANVTADTVDVNASHTGKLNTLGIAVGAGGVGAGVGIGVSVLNEDSETTAELSGTSISITGNGGEGAGHVNVGAENATKVNYQLYNAGGAVAGVAGSIGVSNVNSRVNTAVKDSTVGTETDGVMAQAAKDIAISGKNTIDFTNKAGTAGAGAVGAGVGVAVNTIDSQVLTSVENSYLYASKDLSVTAEETRNVEQMAVNAAAGGVGAGANVMITNIGKEVDGAYGENLQTDKDGKVTGEDGMDVDAAYTQAENAMNGNRLSSSYTLGVLSEAEVNQMPEAAAGKGAAAEEDKSMVKVTIDGAHLYAGDAVTAEAKETTNVEMNGINASAGLAASVSGAVGILDVHRNSGVEITSAAIDAGSFTAQALQNGESALNIYQGTLGGGFSIGAAYASASTEGKTGVGIGNSQINVKGDADISAEDTGKTAVNAIGVAVAAGGAASVIAAEGTNRGETTVTVDETGITAGGDITVDASRKADEGDSLTVSAIAASGGLAFAGAGVSAIAGEYGKVGAEITGSSRFNAGNAISVSALNAPSVNASTGAVSASVLFGSAAVTVAEANLGSENEHLQTTVSIGDDSTFEAEAMTAEAKADASQTVDMNALSITASPFSASATAQVNTGGAAAYSDVSVDIGKSVFKGHDLNGMDLTVTGSNTVHQNVKAYGISAGTLAATGTNLADTLAHLSTQVTADGNADSRFDEVRIDGKSYAAISNEANGYGGALVDISPYAAKVENDFTADTDVTLKGAWNAAGSLSAQALNGMDIDLTADAVRAAIIGGSGTWLDNVIQNAADVNLTDASITTGGAQSYTAENRADYTGAINGSGYGGLDVNATDFKDDIDFHAAVTMDGSTLESTGDGGGITAFALTDGTLTAKNSLKSAGVIPVALASSAHAITYDNRVNVEGSTLTTDKAGSDITLAAADDTDVKLEALADTQGGVIGAASAAVKNTLNRANTISVDGNSVLHSTNDVNLYAGADTDGGLSGLNLQVLADAYNKTAVPVATKPSLSNTMTQANQVHLDGTAESVRHINAKAGKGVTTVTESAEEYRIWGGTNGKGDVASTAFGDTVKSETTENFVEITGSATAGIHNKLDITIDGQTTTKEPTYVEVELKDEDGNPILDEDGNPRKETVLDTEGGISYDGITVTVKEGEDWFDTGSLELTDMTLVNGLMERYNQVEAYLQAYAEDSDAHAAYAAERDLLLAEMLGAGLAEKSESGDIVPLESIDLPAVELPDIVVSGGNVNIDADKLTGSGAITAQGAPQLSITNNSDLYLAVNDLTISDAGGRIVTNETDVSSFDGTQAADGVSGETPSITVTGGTKDFSDNTDKLVKPDIGIFGDVTNTAGDIEIRNENYDILMQGSVNGRNITISAPKGSVTQTSSTGIFNVGSDPITRLQFSEEVAKKIQTYLYEQYSKNQSETSGSLSFDNYRDYLSWLLTDVGVTLEELGVGTQIVGTDDVTITNNVKYRLLLISYAQKVLGEDATTEEIAAEALKQETEAKAGGFSSWITFLNKVGADYTISKDGLSALESSLTKEQVSVHAGGNVYIDAVNVNIGGLVQSGYGSYATALTDVDAGKVAALDAAWQTAPVTLTDADVMGNDKYLVNGGGEYWNTDTQQWEYEVKVYYNPSTQQLITESVRPEGGDIRITGKVSSTGNGRILAADGTPDVSIDTSAVDRDLKVNSITVNQLSGLITITDKNQLKIVDGKAVDGAYLVTEYRNGQYRQYYVGDTTLPGWTSGTPDYQPAKGTQFAWTGGVTGERIEQKQYTEKFLFWGPLTYSKSDDLLQRIEQVGGKVESTPISSGGETSSMVNGSLITGNYAGGENMLTIKWTYSDLLDENGNPITQASDPTVKKKYDGTAGKIFGYGKYYYTWTETTGDQMSSTTGLKADNAVQIGFIGTDGTGNIQVTSQGNLSLAGNLTNATAVTDGQTSGVGSVNLTSNAGGIASLGSAAIHSDDVNLSAAGDIAVNHAAIGSGASLNAVTTAGNIRFTSADGDLTVERAYAGGTDDGYTASTGSVSIRTEGSLFDAGQNGAAVKGQRIDLVSGGSIGSLDENGTVTNEFRIVGGSDLYSSDTMASSVNAQAKGDIVLTQTDGNMRLGTIVSETGDAVLTVTDGSFVDAHPTEDSASSTAEDKIARWLEAGLISADDTEDSSDKAAEAAKEERLKGLTDRMETLASESEHTVTDYTEAADAFFNDEDMQTAKQTYITALTEANGDTDTINAAYADYKAAQDAYFESKGFTPAEQEVIASYAEVANRDNYGWSQNQLLYAVQDSVLNAEPGEVLTVETPNVSAKNITLNAAKGGVGVDGEAQTIAYGVLNNVDNLKLLASAKAGDLTWGDGSVTIRQQQPITVQVTEGTGAVNVTGRDNVYLAGVKDTQLHLNDIATAGDIRLQGDAGVDVSTLKGENLTIAGGTGSIGSTVNDGGYVHTNMSGAVDVRAEGDISIFQTAGDLQILSAATEGTANFKADGSILMYNVPGSTAQGYINAGTKLNLIAGTGIGTEDTGIRVLDNGAVVNASTQSGGIYLAGTNSSHTDDGTLVLGTLTGESVNVTGEGFIQLGREDAEGSISTTDGDVTLAAAKDIGLDNGSITAKTDGSGTVDLTARGGSVTQSKDSAGSIHAGAVNISTTGSQILASAENVISRFAAEGLGEAGSINGSIDFVSAAENVTVGFGKEGDESRHITVHDGGITVTHDTKAEGGGSLSITGSATTKTADDIDASIAFTSTGGITNDGTLDSADAVTMTAKGDIKQTGDVTAADDASFTTTGGAISLGGSVTSTDASVKADTDSGAITVTGSASAAQDVSLTTDSGAVTIGTEGDTTSGSVTAGTDVTVTTGSGDVTVYGSTEAGNDATFHSDEGNIALKGSITTTTGDVIATTGDAETHTGSGDITIGGAITSGKDVTADTENGNITFVDEVHADSGRITANAGGDGNIRVTDDLSALGDISLAVNNGGIRFEGSEAGVHEEILVTSTSGNISLTAQGAGHIMDTNGEGETGDWAILTAAGEGGEGGNITVRHDGTGDIDLYELTAKNDARVYAAGEGGTGGNIHIVNLNGDLVAIVTKNPDAEMRVEHMTAASRIELTGSNINLDTIRQREDGDGFLVLDLEASDPAQPITSLIIRDLGSPVGTRFEQLWLKDGFIHSSSGALHFDKLFVEDLFTAETPYMKTDVWGAPPVLDPSKDTIYWIDTSKNRPSVSLNDWYDPSVDGGWMYLHFDGAAPLQDSNGHLLYGKNGSEVYSRRHSLVEWMNRFQDRDFYDGERAAETLLSYHDRYGLISGGGAAAENADESEITVE